MSQKPELREHSNQRGKLCIGNDWNAVTIIALSQSNPLKAIAELIENSIDALRVLSCHFVDRFCRRD